jgi:hypothetical protein
MIPKRETGLLGPFGPAELRKFILKIYFNRISQLFSGNRILTNKEKLLLKHVMADISERNFRQIGQ